MNFNYPEIVILSKLPNRLRVKLTSPLRNPKDILDKLNEHEGIVDCRYNSVIQSLLINFNSSKIEVEEVLIRISILYAKENGFKPVKIVSSSPKREVPTLAYYSLGLIAVSGVSKLFIQNKVIQDFFNWVTAGTTVWSIVEHAKNEFESKGTVDPEVVSSMYLLNSIKNGEFIKSSLLTWVTTYGRHFINLNFEEVLIKVRKISKSCTNETFYDVSVISEHDTNKNMTFIKALVSKYIDKQTNGKSNLTFTNNNMSLVQNKHFSGFKNECEKIVFTNNGYKYICV